MTVLDLARWSHPADDDDRALLDLCSGPTLDVGCGPGRLSEALAERGQVVLGIDVLTGAVGATLRRGAPALCRDVFDELPGEGRWRTVLVADGNIGIGGDPVALLRRLRDLLEPGGRVVAEVEAPGVPLGTAWATLRSDEETSAPFLWSVVGVDDIEAVAARAGLLLVELRPLGDRWSVVLEAG